MKRPIPRRQLVLALAVVGAVLLASALLVSAGLLVMAVALGLRGERVP
jgi:hypothetical protein